MYLNTGDEYLQVTIILEVITLYSSLHVNLNIHIEICTYTYIKVLSNATEFFNDISLITINGRHNRYNIVSQYIYMQVMDSLEKLYI